MESEKPEEITPADGLSETQPSAIDQPEAATAPQAEEQPEPQRKRLRLRKWQIFALLGILLLLLIAGGSGLAGYNAAIQERTRYQGTLEAGEAAAQFDLALQDIAAGNYARAQQRLEYIIRLDPNFPNAVDQLSRVLVELRTTATPTLAPTPTLTPTPDFRSRDQLYEQAQGFLRAGEWSNAIDALLTLRKRYPDFNAVQVDGMLFVALRNRGVDRIKLLADLEGGTYDLALAERFGPLDTEAANYRGWAEDYIRGASYWNVDWASAVEIFAQLHIDAPYLTDASGWTSSARYTLALLSYGDYLAANGEWCAAQVQYDTYMSLIADSQVEPTAVFASDQCSQGAPAVEEPPIIPEPTATPTPESSVLPASTPYP